MLLSWLKSEKAIPDLSGGTVLWHPIRMKAAVFKGPRRYEKSSVGERSQLDSKRHLKLWLSDCHRQSESDCVEQSTQREEGKEDTGPVKATKT